MTTNQTIDGVPRELLERACVNIFRTTGGQKVVDELRALLDAPAPAPVPVAWMRFDDDQKAIFTRSKRSRNSEALYAHPTAYRHAAPAAQSKGEPVACATIRVERLNDRLCATVARFDVDQLPVGSLINVYAEQPAPVAVKLPERKNVSVGVLSESNTHNQGWNACLDEVTRLNTK